MCWTNFHNRIWIIDWIWLGKKKLCDEHLHFGWLSFIFEHPTKRKKFIRNWQWFSTILLKLNHVVYWHCCKIWIKFVHTIVYIAIILSMDGFRSFVRSFYFYWLYWPINQCEQMDRILFVQIHVRSLHILIHVQIKWERTQPCDAYTSVCVCARAP